MKMECRTAAMLGIVAAILATLAILPAAARDSCMINFVHQGAYSAIRSCPFFLSYYILSVAAYRRIWLYIDGLIKLSRWDGSRRVPACLVPASCPVELRESSSNVNDVMPFSLDDEATLQVPTLTYCLSVSVRPSIHPSVRSSSNC